MAYDIGQSDAPDYNKSHITLSGGTLGFRFALPSVTVNAAYSKALAVPEFLTKKQSVWIVDARLSL